MKKKLIIAPIVIVVLLFVDLLSKGLIFKFIGEGNTVTLIKNLLFISPVYNTGASFGMLQGWQWFFIVSAVVVLGLYTWYFLKSKDKSPLFIVTYAFIFAGAFGNMVDRIAFFKVRDFILIDFFPAVFNFADICITVGVILFVVWCILDFVKGKKEKQNGKV